VSFLPSRGMEGYAGKAALLNGAAQMGKEARIQSILVKCNRLETEMRAVWQDEEMDRTKKTMRKET
ncbi:MAG: hypothetical protein LUQ25_07495, partial [Methanoregulaceae archaeon]|nr:hypothetical protein [Methanoregulaceae archaeon]